MVVAISGTVKVYTGSDCRYVTITRDCKADAVMVKILRLMASIRMYVAVLAVIVIVFARGAMMWINPAGAVTVTAGDKGAMMMRSAPIGPVVEKLHDEGEM